MEAVLRDELSTSLRTKVGATFGTTETAVVDLGVGRSAVAIQLTANMDAGNLTFRGAIDDSGRSITAPTAPVGNI